MLSVSHNDKTDFIDHSCFSRSVNCGAATMENGCQVTILDSEALESWNLDWILIWPSILSHKVFGCIWLVSRELRHYKRPKIDNIHYGRPLGHYNFKFCDSVSPQMCDLVKEIYLKNMKVRGFISLSDTKWQLVVTIFVVFLSPFPKKCLLGSFSWMGQIDKVHRTKLQYFFSL